MMSFDAGPARDAALDRDGDRWTLVFVRELKHPPEVVWAALTDPVELDKWAPFAAAENLDEVGETTLTVIDGDQRVDQSATVLRADPPRRLEYTWGDDLLRWELEPTGSGTRLILRHTSGQPGVEPMVAAGWHLCVAVLGRALDGDPVPVIRGRDAMAYGFEQLREQYAVHLGI
jgi:uncharacterized protein YndB with AHSA1/START domain